jgi:cephalosporin hydroxylase
MVCDLHKLTPFASDSVDEILAVHVVEHFWRWEVLDVLKEWVRVLKPGGQMILECPNLSSACEEFLKNPSAAATGGPEGQRSMWVFYGDPRWQDPYMVHRWGYTPSSLAQLMEEAGLVNVRQEAAQFKLREPRDMRVVAEKPANGGRPIPPLASRSERTGTANEVAIPMANTESSADAAPKETIAAQRVGDRYLTWFYDTGVWKTMTWRGIRTLKFPSDLWNYQEIIHEHKVDWVIEAGTRHGGSALFFAESLAARQAKGKVISIDIDASSRQIDSHPWIEFLIGDSGSPSMVETVAAMLPEDRGPVFLILDSDHKCPHVLRELNMWVPFLQKGDYLVVEDTAINGHPVRPDFGPGPYEAIQQYLASHPDALIPDSTRERKFDATFAPMGYFIKA